MPTVGSLKNINQNDLFILKYRKNKTTSDLLVYIEKQPIYSAEKERLLYTSCKYSMNSFPLRDIEVLDCQV